MARFGFVRACARGQVAVGILFMVLGPLGAAAALVWWPAELAGRVPAEWRGFVPPLTALAALLLGIVIGSRLVLRGQLVLMLVDMRRSLARIDRRLRRGARMEEEQPDDRNATARLLPRR
jgi:hypothetical protein